MTTTHRCLAGALFASALFSCAASGDTPGEKRATIDQMSREVLERLVEEHPQAKQELRECKGYAVFSNASVSVLLVSGGGGYGVVVDRADDSRHYMQMAQGGVGIGLGAKDFRAVFLFHDRAVMKDFIENGWNAGAEADAAAKAGDKGGEASGAGNLSKSTTVYQLTETGLALRANLTGTKYYAYDALNSEK